MRVLWKSVAVRKNTFESWLDREGRMVVVNVIYA